MDFDKYIENQRIKNDLQEARIYDYCCICGAEIYYGNEFFRDYSGEFYCEECFNYKQHIEKLDLRKIAGEED